MRPYTVLWDEEAESKLADIWMKSRDRDAITDSVSWIDELLSKDPIASGEDFYGDWLITSRVLGVTFTVRPLDGVVMVLDVWSSS